MNTGTVIELILAGATALPFGFFLLKRRKKLPPPEPEPEPEAREPEPEPIPPPLSTPQPRRLSEAELIQLIATRIVFSTRLVEVGKREVGQRIVDYKAVPSIVPERDLDIRPIRDLTERPSLLPSERTLPSDLAILRQLSGQAQVFEYFEQVPITEPIYEPEYQQLKHTVYVLLDISGSMYERDEWKIRLARGAVLGLAVRARAEGSVFLCRPFWGEVGGIQRVDSDRSLVEFECYLQRLTGQNNTDITTALNVAIQDVTNERFETADVMIVTDGEDGALDPSKMRAKLDRSKIRLHAVLLGTSNEGLRSTAHSVQQILESGIVAA